MFCLLLCIAAGITPIITSSSDEKLASIQKISSSIKGINYKKTPDITTEAMRITDDKGVDIVVNNTGVKPLPADIATLRKRGGSVNIVGFLAGMTADWNPAEMFVLMKKSAAVR